MYTAMRDFDRPTEVGVRCKNTCCGCVSEIETEAESGISEQLKLSIGRHLSRGAVHCTPCARDDRTVRNIGCEPSCMRRRRQAEGDFPTIFLKARLKAASDA